MGPGNTWTAIWVQVWVFPNFGPFIFLGWERFWTIIWDILGLALSVGDGLTNFIKCFCPKKKLKLKMSLWSIGLLTTIDRRVNTNFAPGLGSVNLVTNDGDNLCQIRPKSKISMVSEISVAQKHRNFDGNIKILPI